MVLKVVAGGAPGQQHNESVGSPSQVVAWLSKYTLGPSSARLLLKWRVRSAEQLLDD